jgi:hypothetical protein
VGGFSFWVKKSSAVVAVAHAIAIARAIVNCAIGRRGTSKSARRKILEDRFMNMHACACYRAYPRTDPRGCLVCFGFGLWALGFGLWLCFALGFGFALGWGCVALQLLCFGPDSNKKKYTPSFSLFQRGTERERAGGGVPID